MPIAALMKSSIMKGVSSRLPSNVNLIINSLLLVSLAKVMPLSEPYLISPATFFIKYVNWSYFDVKFTVTK